ncbi:MAG: hypothetical protein ACYC6T_12675 [Thermoleophilia bacterium]
MEVTPPALNRAPELTMRRVLVTWWPLAASWLLMGLEGPAISAVLARLIDPKINLAAFGGVVFPIALVVEAPIVMLLGASTALCKDHAAYRRVQSFMRWAAITLTAVHALIVFTPLYGFVVETLIHAPPEVVGPARIGLAIMTPWTWAIAYRRFNQGILIRFGHSGAVGAGTVVRLLAGGAILAVGYSIGSVPGIIVAAVAMDAGVLAEAAYAWRRVRPVVRERLAPERAGDSVLSLRSFLAFYVPLSLTSVISLTAIPLGSAAMSRMPNALESLAAWPVVTGLSFMFRSFGFAYNEVVLALVDVPRSMRRLRRFALLVAAATSAGLLVLLIPALGGLWFRGVTGLTENLAGIAQKSLWFAVPLPALSVYQSWLQGMIVHGRRTRGITEAVGLSLLAMVAVLATGVAWAGTTGLYVGMAAFAIGDTVRTIWLVRRSGPIRVRLWERDVAL